MRFYVVKLGDMYLANRDYMKANNHFVQDVIYAKKWLLPDQAGYAITEFGVKNGKVYQIDTVENEVK